MICIKLLQNHLAALPLKSSRTIDNEQLMSVILTQLTAGADMKSSQTEQQEDLSCYQEFL